MKSKERIRTFRCTLVIFAVTIQAFAIDYSSDVQDDWNMQYDVLKERIQIQKANGTAKKIGEEHPHVLDQHTLIWESDKDPLDVVLRRTNALIDHISMMQNAPSLEEQATKLSALENYANSTPVSNESARRDLYNQSCELRRRVAFANPLIDFEQIICMDGEISTGFIQATGWRGGCSAASRHWSHDEYHSTDFTSPIPGEYKYHGGLSGSRKNDGPLILGNLSSGNPQKEILLKDVKAQNGVMEGQLLVGTGSFRHNFDLHYNANEIVVSWLRSPDEQQKGFALHLFRAAIDKSYLVQVTGGAFADFDPCYMPSGRLLFISLRSWTTSRCQPLGKNATNCSMQPGGQLWSIKPDGTDLIRLSFHETNECSPAIDNDGRIVYTRWDYIDRDYNAAQHMWVCNADGTDPRAPHSNWPMPHCLMDECSDRMDRRNWRTSADIDVRPIPNTSGEYISIASHHHGMYPGSPVYIDTKIRDDNYMSQTKIIVGNCVPEEGGEGPQPGCSDGPYKDYLTPWPLDGSFYLISRYINKKGHIYLLDRFGNEELIYNGGAFYPIPLKSRETPPSQPVTTYQGEREGISGRPKATILVNNVYESDFDWPAGVEEQKKIKQLRIIHILPRPWSCPCQDEPTVMGWSTGAIPRNILGTVPVEEDGSAYFEAPINCEIYFQALDEKGMAIQSMRSGTYVHPGEQMNCLGCHEDKWKAVPTGTPSAQQRSPSSITPEVDGTNPLNFHRLVKPVFENKCKPCHLEKGKGPTDFSYDRSLSKLAFYFHASGSSGSISGNHGGYRTTAGLFGAAYSKMGKALLNNHQDRITEEDFQRVVLWLDANSMELSACYDFEKQRNGEIVQPLLGCPPENPMCLDIGGFDCTGPGCLNPVDSFFVSANAPANRAVASRRTNLSVHGGVLKLTSDKASEMSVELFTLSGRRILMHHEKQPVTTTMVRLQDHNFATCTYVVRALIAGEQLVRVIRNR